MAWFKTNSSGAQWNSLPSSKEESRSQETRDFIPLNQGISDQFIIQKAKSVSFAILCVLWVDLAWASTRPLVARVAPLGKDRQKHHLVSNKSAEVQIRDAFLMITYQTGGLAWCCDATTATIFFHSAPNLNFYSQKCAPTQIVSPTRETHPRHRAVTWRIGQLNLWIRLHPKPIERDSHHVS